MVGCFLYVLAWERSKVPPESTPKRFACLRQILALGPVVFAFTHVRHGGALAPPVWRTRIGLWRKLKGVPGILVLLRFWSVKGRGPFFCY